MFYPKNSIDNSGSGNRSGVRTRNSKLKIVIEDQTDKKLDYQFRFSCEGGITLDWSSLFSNSDQEVMYDSSMSRATRFIEKTYIIPSDNMSDIHDFFELKADLFVLIPSNVLSKASPDSSSSIELCLSEASNEIDQFDTCSITDEVVAPTSVRSLEFLTCISQIITETKVVDEKLLDFYRLATELAKAAKKFDLPDLSRISAVFLEFQISDNNFADVLEMAVAQKSAALLESATEFITDNQKELRESDQWEKMKNCPAMLLSVMEKLFIDKK